MCMCENEPGARACTHTHTHTQAGRARCSHTARSSPNQTKEGDRKAALFPKVPSMVTDVWLSLESLGPFTLSSCQKEEKNHFLLGPTLPLPHCEHSRKRGFETWGYKCKETKEA